MHKNNWKPYYKYRSQIEPQLFQWLTFPGSFMCRLEQHGIAEKEVRVLSEEWGFPKKDEKQILKIPSRHYVFAREVLIESSAQIWMFARTVFPRKTLTGKEQTFLHLKNRSLGSRLFSNLHLTRSEFELAFLELPPHLASFNLPKEKLWARRSLFHLKHKPLLLLEFFFPAIAENLCQAK